MYDINIFTLNTLIIHIEIDSYDITEENGKYRVHVKINNQFIEKMKTLEEAILKNIIKKQIVLSCYKFLLFNKSTYVFDKYPETVKLAIRISGLWETESTVGLTTKIYVNDYPSTVKLSNTIC